MLTIKQYANGRYYDAENKKYVKTDELAAMIKKRKKIKIVSSKTGKDITKSVVSKISGKDQKKKVDISGSAENIKNWFKDNPENIRKWFKDNMDLEKQVEKVLNQMNLLTKDKVSNLKSTIKRLDKKVDELEKNQAKKIQSMKKKQARKIDSLEKKQQEMSEELVKKLGLII